VIIGAHGALFVWFIRRALPESPRWLAQKGRLEEADRVLSQLEEMVAKELRRPLPSPDPQSQSVSSCQTFFDIWKAPYAKRASMMITFNVCQTVGFYGFANWVPTLLVKQGITLTTSLLYSSIIAIAAPVGPLIGLVIGDKYERKSVIVATAAAIVVCGLAFSQVSRGMLLIAMGVGITLASNIMSYSFHAYQTELFPTNIRSSAVGFVYSWSRFSAIFTSFLIAGVLKSFGTTGVFVFIAAAMLIVMAVIGWMGPRTRDLALEEISQ
jgi:putative MFS transporter